MIITLRVNDNLLRRIKGKFPHAEIFDFYQKAIAVKFSYTFFKRWRILKAEP